MSILRSTALLAAPGSVEAGQRQRDTDHLSKMRRVLLGDDECGWKWNAYPGEQKGKEMKIILIILVVLSVLMTMLAFGLCCAARDADEQSEREEKGNDNSKM